MPSPKQKNNPQSHRFDNFDCVLDQITKIDGETYPPYNSERIINDQNKNEQSRITMAVAPIEHDCLEITLADNHLIIIGSSSMPNEGDYLYQAIATS